jgi:putative dimethyl sulfoxide reductase chaperone
MTKEERERFCELLARLFSPPDQEMIEQIHQGNIHSFLEHYIQSWGGKTGLLKGFLIEDDPEILFRDLKEEYSRLFSDVGGENISLVESFYKPWTQDPHCILTFASEKGLLMGDSAIHLSTVYQECGLETGEEFQGMPDHLIVELEFLSYLYRWGGDKEIKMFMEDHLDWIPLLKEEFRRFRPHPFYRSLLEVLDLFLGMERKRLEMESDGKKNIH